MTAKPAHRATTSIAAPVGDGSDDSYVRQKGRAFIIALYSALRALKLYPAGHATAKRALDDLAAVSQDQRTSALVNVQ